MDSHVSHDKERRSLATDNVLVSVVQRLVDRGVIEPEEADDMLALLSAVSDLSDTSVITSNRDWLQQHGSGVRRRSPRHPNR